jgi:hypothetical protein
LKKIISFLLLAVSSFHASDLTAQPSFAPPVSYTVNPYPVEQLTGDFNKDGHTDLLLTSLSGNSLALLLGNGDGTFRTKTDIDAGMSTLTLAKADFNGDGNLDFITSNLGPQLKVFFGNGIGGFSSPISYSISSGSVRGIVLADFNGDGKPDFAATNNGNNAASISIFLNSGSGSFSTRTDLSLPNGSKPYGIATADFNGDGVIDLISANENGTVSLLLGIGNGSFATAVHSTVDTDAKGITAGDLNNDGKVDFVVSNYNSYKLNILLGNGDGTFQPKIQYDTTSETRALYITDINGDGKPDLIFPNEGANTRPAKAITILLGNGNGTFQPKVDYITNAKSESLIVADLNGDGKIDIVYQDQFTDNSDKINVLFNISVLPVELHSLSAQTSGNRLTIKWKTTSERNNSHFIIQTSQNGSEWTEATRITSKAGGGNSSTELDYQVSITMTDTALAGCWILGILLLPATRSRLLKLLFLALLLANIAACAKYEDPIDTSGQLKSGQQRYLRQAQVDLDGKTSYSQVVVVK